MLVAVGALKVVDDFPLVPDVVAGGDDIDAQVEKFFRQRWRDTETAGGVLSIADDEINGVLLHQSGQAVLDDVAPGPAENVAYEENFHMWKIMFRC